MSRSEHPPPKIGLKTGFPQSPFFQAPISRPTDVVSKFSKGSNFLPVAHSPYSNLQNRFPFESIFRLKNLKTWTFSFAYLPSSLSHPSPQVLYTFPMQLGRKCRIGHFYRLHEAKVIQVLVNLVGNLGDPKRTKI